MHQKHWKDVGHIEAETAGCLLDMYCHTGLLSPLSGFLVTALVQTFICKQTAECPVWLGVNSYKSVLVFILILSVGAPVQNIARTLST